MTKTLKRKTRVRLAAKKRKVPKPSQLTTTRKSKIDSAQKPKYYLTTAIAYPNGPPHIGHAYEAIATDAIARFMRLDGYDVFFLTGTDEHGSKMLQTAAKENLTPRELVERNVPQFQAMVKKFNCSNDAFIRTTDPRHYLSSQAIWTRMQQAGDIYLGKYSGWYSVRDEAYYDESETRADENGQRLGPNGSPVEWVEEESYFFKLSKYAKKLLKLYKDEPNFVLPRARMNEVESFVRGGLQDLSISRTTFEWGVPVPRKPKHVMYVWVDALTNYITALGYPDTKNQKFKRYWPADLHVIGKDIVRFHAVYWPAFLMSARIAVPKRIYSHGFLFNRGEKMSKSVGNVVDPFDLADTYGVDQLRYFFLREIPFGQDGNYSHDAIINRTNADLANDLGNLAQRSLSMINKQFGGVLPDPTEFTRNDENILGRVDGLIRFSRDVMKFQQLHKVLEGIWTVVAETNRYFAGEAPWALAKTDPARQGTILYVTAEVLRQIGILAQPFMPGSAEKLLDLLAVPSHERDFSFLHGEHRIAPGALLPVPTPVFPRYVENEREWQEFFKSAGQYYVVARYAAFAGFIPITGNLFHHTIEMFLKGGLSKGGMTFAELKRLGHDLPKIWTRFKATFNDPALDQFDDTLSSLHRFEDIRYPDSILSKGMLATIDITRHAPLTNPPGLNLPRQEPTYELCVQDIDELVGEIFAITSANPSALLSMQFHKPEAQEYLKKENTVSSLIK
jgi:methionyl-tRNA synthetase